MTNRRNSPRRALGLLASAGMVCALAANTCPAEPNPPRPAEGPRRIEERVDDEGLRRDLLEGEGELSPESARIAERVRALMDEARAVRQKGDSAGAAAKFQQARALMSQQRDQQVAQIRAILTAEQRVQFDRNVAEMKQREAERGQRGFGRDGGRGPRGERGQKGAQRGR